MRELTDIDREIAEVKDRLKNVEGTRTEIYTRIVGYYRSLKNWNRGKREEYALRQTFVTDVMAGAGTTAKPGNSPKAEPSKVSTVTWAPVTLTRPADDVGYLDPDEADLQVSGQAEYLYFFRKECPNCAPVRSLLTDLEERGRAIDVDTEEGMQLAMDHQILATPTVIYLDAQGREARRATSIHEIREALAV